MGTLFVTTAQTGVTTHGWGKRKDGVWTGWSPSCCHTHVAWGGPLSSPAICFRGTRYARGTGCDHARRTQSEQAKPRRDEGAFDSRGKRHQRHPLMLPGQGKLGKLGRLGKLGKSGGTGERGGTGMTVAGIRTSCQLSDLHIGTSASPIALDRRVESSSRDCSASAAGSGSVRPAQ